ncbi:MAG: TfuA-like protein, partial [Actinomycetota bacterium]|nr:TfuA-like protein [Actinomycetota bacterium]
MTIRPPVAQGDVYRSAQRRPDAIGIIDGYFERIPAVWHKEILHALQQGVRVYGAASMGALRAAELHQFGMVGVGRIFDQYAGGELVADDEVAIAHTSAEEGYRSSSEALVNIRATLTAALDGGVIDPSTAAKMLDISRATFYPERNWPELLESLAADGSAETAGSLRDWLVRGRIDQKRIDAEELVVRVRDDLLSGVAAEPAGFRLSHTVWWDHLVQHAGVVVDDQHAVSPVEQGAATVVLDAALDELRLVPAEYQQVWLSALMRQLAL